VKRKKKRHAEHLEEADDPQAAEPDNADKRRASVLAGLSPLLAAIWAGTVIWNAGKQEYETPKGAVVSSNLLRAEFEKVVTDSRNTMRLAADNLLNGVSSIPEWQAAMLSELKALHYLAWATSQGGPDHLSPSDMAKLGGLIQTQVDFLNKRAEKIDTGQQALDGTLRSTSGLYANASRGIYAKGITNVAEKARIEWVERVRNSNESCPDCVDWEGFWKIDEVPPIGSSVCGGNCLCDIEPIESLDPGQEVRDPLAEAA
jgi:hypothetical protein